MSSLSLANADPRTWICNIKLSLNEVCAKFDLDIENDNRNRIFWNININQRVLVNEDVLGYLGYSGKTYHQKKIAFFKLLRKNDYIKYSEIACDSDPRKKYYVLSSLDFESLIMQMRTDKVVELRNMFSKMKYIITKYNEYEKFYERYQTQILQLQNNRLAHNVEELKEILLNVQTSSDKDRLKAEEDRIKAEEERNKALQREQFAESERRKAQQREEYAEQERKKAEMEREKSEAERFRAQARSERLEQLIEDTNYKLNTTIGPNLSPAPISKGKCRSLGLYSTPNKNEWYLMRRQEECWREAESRLELRGMKLLCKWTNVAHAVDIGNSVKHFYRTQFSWHAKGNVLRSNVDYVTDADLIQVISYVLFHENEAFVLAKRNKDCL